MTCDCNYCDSRKHHNFIRGGVDIDDFYKDVNYKKASKKSSRSAKAGCPGNDNREHVYMWVGWWDYLILKGQQPYDPRYFWYNSREWRICIGCGKQPARKTSRHKS